MSIHHHITGEIGCYFNCVIESSYSWMILLLIASAILLFITYLFITIPTERIKIYISGQFLIVSAIFLSFTVMKCDSMFTINVYVLYTLTTLLMLVFISKIYERLLIRRLNAFHISLLMDWPQTFVDKLLANANVYYYDSAIPRAFACGRSIFLSVGLLEMLSEKELKAVLAHESWHLKHNHKTHWLKQLSFMTFIPMRRSDIERMADLYAINKAGKDTLDSVRSKLFFPVNPH